MSCALKTHVCWRLLKTEHYGMIQDHLTFSKSEPLEKSIIYSTSNVRNIEKRDDFFAY